VDSGSTMRTVPRTRSGPGSGKLRALGVALIGKSSSGPDGIVRGRLDGLLLQQIRAFWRLCAVGLLAICIATLGPDEMVLPSFP